MPDVSRGVLLAASVVLVLSVLCYLTLMANVLSMNASDPAGRGMGQSVAGITVIVLWVLLAILFGIVASTGAFAPAASGAALVLIVASGVAAFVAVNLAARSPGSSAAWPSVVPALAPLVLLAYALWASIPALRAMIAPNVAGGAAAFALVALSLLPWPFARASTVQRKAYMAHLLAESDNKRAQEEAVARRARRERFDQLPKDATLSRWMEFLGPREDATLRNDAIAAIASLASRQQDAEALLARGDSEVMYHLPVLALTASPALCDGARTFLRAAAAKVNQPSGDGPRRTLSYYRVDSYLPAIEWLAAHGCRTDAEVAAIEAGIRSYAPSPERDEYLATLARVPRATP